ncbi:MAG: ATP-binding protein [Bacteroidota bacterium]
MYKRKIDDIIAKYIGNKEFIILFGARQIGKTTTLNNLFSNNQDALIFNCERPEILQILENFNISELKLLFGDKKIIALDEAQCVPNIGKVLKLIYDSPEFTQKIIATGSSSFDLSNKINEPLTGRNLKFKMFPLSYQEIVEHKTWLWCKENIDELLIFGSYPGVIDKPISEKPKYLSNLSSDYLFKDVLALENIKNPLVLRKLLQLLAWQIGSEVSMNELAMQLGISMKTVEKYIDLLEKSFVIFGLHSFSRNMRNELKKSRKYYFFDLGIRNALINNFSGLSSRTDKGAIWENFCISERYKNNETSSILKNMYFWRTYDGAEIDLVEEKDGNIECFEFKISAKRKTAFPQSFEEAYKPKSNLIVSPENVHEFLL